MCGALSCGQHRMDRIQDLVMAERLGDKGGGEAGAQDVLHEAKTMASAPSETSGSFGTSLVPAHQKSIAEFGLARKLHFEFGTAYIGTAVKRYFQPEGGFVWTPLARSRLGLEQLSTSD